MLDKYLNYGKVYYQVKLSNFIKKKLRIFFEEDMQKCSEQEKIYVGQWPIREGETGRIYLDLIHSWAKKGCILPDCYPAFGAEKDFFPEAKDALEYWYSLS